MVDPPHPAGPSPFCIVVLAASRGGIDALSAILRDLPADLEAAVFAVLHIGDRPSILPEILGRVSPLPVMHAVDGAPIRPGTVTIAPPDRHLELAADRLVLHRGPKEHFTRPAADPLFRSAARAFGPRVIAVVLTGGDRDGTLGLAEVTGRGGLGLVEDPDGAVAPDMPVNALNEDHPQFCASLPQLGRLLARLVELRNAQLALIQPPPSTSSPS